MDGLISGRTIAWVLKEQDPPHRFSAPHWKRSKHTFG